jgi:hypothetical protein
MSHLVSILSILLRACSKRTAEAPERVENINVQKLHSIVKEQGIPVLYLKQRKIVDGIEAQRLRTLEEDNRNLTDTLQSFVEEFNVLRSSSGQPVSNCVCSSFVYVHLTFKILTQG